MYKNITLRVKSDVYDNYRKYCSIEGLVISRQFEKLMESTLKKQKKMRM